MRLSHAIRAFYVFMSLYAVAMYTRGLMVGFVPEFRVVRAIRRVDVVNTLRYNRAAIIQPQGAKLVLRSG